MKSKKTPFTIDQEIFIHLMTNAYREGLRAGKELTVSVYDTERSKDAVTQFYHGLSDMLREPEKTVSH